MQLPRRNLAGLNYPGWGYKRDTLASSVPQAEFMQVRAWLARSYFIPAGASQRRGCSSCSVPCRTCICSVSSRWFNLTLTSNRPHFHAQNGGTILMGVVLWRVNEKACIRTFWAWPKPDVSPQSLQPEIRPSGRNSGWRTWMRCERLVR